MIDRQIGKAKVMIGAARSAGFLRVELLRPGDVILCASPSLESRAIRLATLSEYSHAILVIEPLHWIEASDPGTTFHPVFIDKVEGVAPEFRWLYNTQSYEKFDVYRHPDVRDPTIINPNDLLKTAMEYYAQQYPPLTKLARTSWIPNRLAEQILEEFDNKSSDERRTIHLVNSGKFCSELVAEIYSRLNLPLFEKTRNPNEVSPGSLGRSRLVKVEGIQCDEAPEISNNLERAKQLNRIAILNSMGAIDVQLKTVAELTSYGLEKFNKSEKTFFDQIAQMATSDDPDFRRPAMEILQKWPNPSKL